MVNVSNDDVECLYGIFNRLREFHHEWDGRVDDPEDMWIEAPEMVADLVKKMEPIMKRLNRPGVSTGA